MIKCIQTINKKHLYIAISSLLFICAVLIWFPAFFPHLEDINLWDEAIYINMGRQLVEDGTFPTLAWSPLLAWIYGIFFLITGNHPLWLLVSCSLGRILFFLLLWIATSLLTMEVAKMSKVIERNEIPGLLSQVVLVIFPFPLLLLTNPSDALYAGLLAFALTFLIRYLYEKTVQNLIISSLLIGMSSLVRNDGWVVYLLISGLLVIFGMTKKITLNRLTLFFIPFIVVISSFILLRGLITQDYRLHIGDRTYVAFEQGQQFVSTSDLGLSSMEGAVLDARSIYGTPEENENSVFRAISNNPDAFIRRLVVIIRGIPTQIVNVYGERLSVVLLGLSVIGMFVLLRAHYFDVAMIFVLIFLSLGVYLITFFRVGYYLLVSPLVVTLCTTGYIAIVKSMRLTTLLALCVALLTILIGIIKTNDVIIYGAVFLAILSITPWFINFITSRLLRMKGRKSYFAKDAIVVILCIVIIMIVRGDKVVTQYQLPGNSPDERATLAIRNAVSPGSKVVAGAPGAVWMAKMEYATIDTDALGSSPTAEALYAWLIKNDIKIIYLDRYMKTDMPIIRELVLELEKAGHLKLIYGSGSENEGVYQKK